MQTHVYGVRQQSGIGKESKQNYDIAPQIWVSSPLTQVDRPNLKIRCAGYEPMLLDCSEEVMVQLLRLPYDKFPVVADLDTQLVKRGDTVVPKVVGIKSKVAA